MPSTTHAREGTCLTRTCLQWTAEGELCAEDKQLVLNKLKKVDRSMAEFYKH